MKLELKENFEIVEEGTTYKIPTYRVEDGKGIVLTGKSIVLNFVRGSKLGGEEVPKREGTLHEHVLATMIADLKHKHSLVPSEEGFMVIKHLQEALGWLRERQIDRQKRGVQGTYQK